MTQQAADLRRYPRARVSWRVLVEVAGSRPLMRETVDFSPFGAKVRLEQRLGEGTIARLRFSAPDHQPLSVDAVVARTDSDGPVFIFTGVSQQESTRFKSLVDSHRRP